MKGEKILGLKSTELRKLILNTEAKQSRVLDLYVDKFLPKDALDKKSHYSTKRFPPFRNHASKALRIPLHL